MRNFFAFAITVVIAVALFVACGDETTKSYNVTYAGMAMKGPFYAGGNVTAFACDEKGIQTGAAYTANIESSTGNFTLDADVKGTVIVKAVGVYFNEIYNESSTGTIRVEAVFNATGAGTQNAFLNPISHAISACKLKMIRAGSPGDPDLDANSELACAEKLFDELGLPKPSPFNLAALHDIQTPYPTAFSCGILQAARLIAQDDKTKFDTELQRILDQTKIELASGISDTPGTLSNNTKTIFRNGFATLDAETCRSNLQIYLDNEGSGIPIPPLGAALDSDADGIPDSLDEDMDNDGVANELDCVNGISNYLHVTVNDYGVCAAKKDNQWQCYSFDLVPYGLAEEKNWQTYSFTKVVSGFKHWCGIVKDENTLWCWDANGAYSEKSSSLGWQNVFAGENRTCAIDLSNILYCNDTQVNEDTDWSSMSLGNDKFYATKTDGTLWSWNFGEVPVQIGTDLWKFVSNDSLYAIKTDGTLWYVSDFITPIQVGSDTDWASVYGTCATKSDNTLWCWTDTDKTPATKTDSVGWSCGEWHALSHINHDNEYYCGIKTDSSLWCWKGGVMTYIK